MAELGDLLTGGSQSRKDVAVEMLDYDYLNKCKDPDLIRDILRKLESGEEGHFPHLIQHAVKRLLEELPKAKRTKILRMKAEPHPDEIYEAFNDLHNWEEEIIRVNAASKGESQERKRAPGWTSCTEQEATGRIPKVIEIAALPPARRAGDDEKTPTASGTAPSGQLANKRLNAYDFRAWEGYDAEGEIDKLEKEEEEEERRKREAITSAKAQIEDEERRRAKKRKEQMQQAIKGRFKESLSRLERKRAADRERLKGNESFKAQEFEEAFRCYTCSLALDDEEARVYNNRAAAAQKLERFEQAEDDCTRAVSLDPVFKKAWMRRGMVRHSRGKYGAAVADFNMALDIDPADKHAQKLKEHSAAKEREVEGESVGEKEANSHRKGGGRVLIEEIEEADHPQDGGVQGEYVNLGAAEILAPPTLLGSEIRTVIAHGWIEDPRGELQKGVRDRIQQTWQQDVAAMEQGPRRVDVNQYDSEDEDSETLASLKALGIDAEGPTAVEDLTQKAKEAYARQNWEEASTLFMGALRLRQRAGEGDDSLGTTRDNIAACMLQLGKYELVLEYTDNATKDQQPPDQKVLLRRWLAFSKLGNTEGAATMLAQLEDMAPDVHMQEAVESFKDTVAEAERDEAMVKCDQLRKDGNELMKEGQKEQAIAKYTKALEANPTDVPASNNRAQANIDLHRFEDAEHDASLALKYDPGNLKARYRRARARAQKREPDAHGACADLVIVVARDPAQNTAVKMLRDLVKSLNITEGPIRLKKRNSSFGHVGFTDGTEPGDEVAADEAKIAHDREMEAMHPETAKTHWPSEKEKRSGLVIAEDDSDGDGCSWCPVANDGNREEGVRVAQECCTDGDQMCAAEDWNKALDAYARGAVADPLTALCWLGLARVHRHLENYSESLEAASRAHKVNPSRGSLLCTAISRYYANAGVRSEEERLDDLKGEFGRVEELEENESDQSWKAEHQEIYTILQSNMRR